jgi:hypothetical protein
VKPIKLVSRIEEWERVTMPLLMDVFTASLDAADCAKLRALLLATYLQGVGIGCEATAIAYSPLQE